MPLSLSEHLKRFGAVNCSRMVALDALVAFLKEVASARIKMVDIQEWDCPLHFLAPIASDPTRYVVFEDNGWSYILSNYKQSVPECDIYGINRATRGKAIAISTLHQDRRLYVYENGRPVREIQSNADGRWYYYEVGDPLDFEDPGDRKRRSRKDRLKPGVLAEYFRRFTGRAIPDWRRVRNESVCGFEVSYPLREVPLVEYCTVLDVE